MQAVNTLLDLAETYAGHASCVAQQSVSSVKGAHADDSLTRAEADLKVREKALKTRTEQC
jgi:hypothetical protein